MSLSLPPLLLATTIRYAEKYIIFGGSIVWEELLGIGDSGYLVVGGQKEERMLVSSKGSV